MLTAHQQMALIRAYWNMRKTRMFNNVIWIAGGQFIIAVTGVVGLRVLTELVSPAVLGQASLLMTAMTLGMHIIVAPVSNTQLRYHSQFVARGQDGWFSAQILKRALLASICVSVVAGVAFMIWDMIEGHGHGLPLVVLVILFLWAPIYATRNTLINRLVAERRQVERSVWLSLETILMVGLTALLVSRVPTVEMYLAGQLAGVLAVALMFFLMSPFVRRVKFFGPHAGVSNAVGSLVSGYGLPFMGLAILGWLNNLADRYVLAALLDTVAVGYYVAASAISSRAVQMSVGIITDAFSPALFEAENASDPIKAAKLFRIWLGSVTALVIVVVAAIWQFSAPIATLLLAEEYRAEASSIMHWIAIGYGMFAVTGVLENRILSFGVSKKLFWPMAVGAGTTVALSFLIIPVNGLSGAAQASAIGSGLQMCVTMLVLYRTCMERSKTALKNGNRPA